MHSNCLPLVFTFPGQGSYRGDVLRELYQKFPQTHGLFQQADSAARRFLGHGMLDLVQARSAEEHDAVIGRCPDLDQLGIYLTEVAIATSLVRAGVRPDILVGHSFGEISALAVAGAIDIDTGFRIICQRTLALHDAMPEGGMAAVSCSSEAAQRVLDRHGIDSVVISVRNHPRQTVLSGPRDVLERMNELFNPEGISLTLLASRYPFHSPMLETAVRPFRINLGAYDFSSPSLPVMLCTECRMLHEDDDLTDILSSHFVTPLDFISIVDELLRTGSDTFVECGAGDILTRILEKNLGDDSDVCCLATAASGAGVEAGIEQCLQALGAGRGNGSVAVAASQDEITDAMDHRVDPRLEHAQKLMSTMLSDLSVVVKNMSNLVQNTLALMQMADRNALGTNIHDINALHADALQSLEQATAPLHATAPREDAPGRPPVQQQAANQPGGDPDARETSEFPTDEPGRIIRVSSDTSHGAAGTEGVGGAMPIAIVGMGCVLPGAADPDEFWDNIMQGVSGVVDLAERKPDLARDFLAGSVTGVQEIVPDKTYTLLSGNVEDVDYDQKRFSGLYTEQEFSALTRGEKMLAASLAQAMEGTDVSTPSGPANGQCIIGATADGSSEYDEALFVRGMRNRLSRIDGRHELKDKVSRLLGSTMESSDHPEQLEQHSLYTDVVARFVPGCRTYVIDTACSSSLYAVQFGIHALRMRESDFVLAGGVFAPGPANNTLFAQFRGLTPKGSRPFDAEADGVVFGDGAAFIMLKRLDDAVEQGDRVLGVIRGVGLSSDGKSPSINVPRAEGQRLAMQRVYDSTGLDIGTIQYLEAHATATPVGDAVEFNAMKDVMADRDPSLPAVEIGSVKSLIGHTGWLSGAASIIKLCKMFQNRAIPGQYNFAAPNPGLDMGDSPFHIPTRMQPWPGNISGLPRRAGINGFGFGGTDAHVVIEEFDSDYHRELSARRPSVPERAPLAVVGIGGLLPGSETLEIDAWKATDTAASTFRRDLLRLPKKKILLPDVMEHMDISQYLAVLAAERILDGMDGGWEAFRQDIGVVLGMESKTERGIQANERIYLDRMMRLLTGMDGSDELREMVDALSEKVRSDIIPSGAYTLPGLMPNVTASRITHMFDLKGPNAVIDMGRNSMFQALHVAQQMLTNGDCKVVLTGGIHAAAQAYGDAGAAEAAVMIGLANQEFARSMGLPVLALLDIAPVERNAHVDAGNTRAAQPDYHGAQGWKALLDAIHSTQESAETRSIPEQVVDSTGRAMQVTVSSSDAAGEARNSDTGGDTVSADDATDQGSHAYIRNTPIYNYTPEEVETPPTDAPADLGRCRILFLTDDPDEWKRLQDAGGLDGLDYRVACAQTADLKNQVFVDIESDKTIAGTISSLDASAFDTVIAVKNLANREGNSILDHGFEVESRLLDLLFAVTRHLYDAISDGSIHLATLCVSSYRGEHIDPCTGLFAGFMKSTVRELPDAVIRIVNTDEIEFQAALKQTAVELGQTAFKGEACYRDGSRFLIGLRPVRKLTSDQQPYISRESVVIATGGGRGVTAVMAEALLRQYGCTVMALGRTDPQEAPGHILDMSEAQFREYEPQFYRDRLTEDPKPKIIDLKRQYNRFQAMNEIVQTSRRLQELPGHFEYHSLDINDTDAVEQFIDDIFERFGRLDLLIHGAGIQISKSLTKKSMDEFHKIVDTKVGSLARFYKAIGRRGGNGRTHYHLLTSAFSFMGNDGQPDYGAANETMNRLADALNVSTGHGWWSSIAWLGWAGVGMTRGSEYAALAASRNLRGITREEGGQLFAGLMEGSPAEAVNILLADGEIAFYGVDIQENKHGRPTSVLDRDVADNEIGVSAMNKRREIHHITLDNACFLKDHVVNGMATTPAAFLTTLVAETARSLRPDMKIISFERTRYHKFVRIPADRGLELRVEARIESEGDNEALLYIEVRSDFVHKSGMVLKKDVLHKETVVRMAKSIPNPPDLPMEPEHIDARRLPDPYVMEGSVVQLDGQFNSMKNIRVWSGGRKADYRIARSSYPEFAYRYHLPTLIMVDSFWRFGAIHMEENGDLPLYVPEECKRMDVYFDFTKFSSHLLMGQMQFTGYNPVLDGELLRLGDIAVRDAQGRILLTVEGAVCRRFGEIRHAESA